MYPPILDQLDRGAPVDLTRVSGGCIADARVATFADGSSVFVKCITSVPGMFESEAQGLTALADAQAIRIPRVIAVGEDALVLELIRSGPRSYGFFEDFGRSLAQLHQYRGKTCGFGHDNFIGATRQRNDPLNGSWNEAPVDDGSAWPEFFLQRRLRFQTRLAGEKGHGTELDQWLDRAEKCILDLLSAAPEPPCILHGDLWGGNYMVDESGAACLIDPAVYFGHREAELAMTHLFGGFDRSFYGAYVEVLPLGDGHQDRLPIYQLYHVLNHLNLFGGSYFEESRRILQRYAG